MADANIAGNGAVWVGIEADYGTAVDPTAAGTGIWVPVISESLAYTEDKYFTPQIRNSAVVSGVASSYYHIEGDIVMEVDPTYMPYFLYASRHTVNKSGTGTPYTYSAEPTNVGAAYPGGTAVGLSIAVQRNELGFLYYGCVVNQWAFTIENGVLRVTMSILGLGEQDTSTNTFTESWVDPVLLGADAHEVFVDAAGTTPVFASADETFNGFTFTANYNGAAQNRLVPDRAATFVSYGEVEATYETELDFTSKAEYDNMKANTLRAIKLESIGAFTPTRSWANATSGFRIICYRTAYSTYEVGLSGIGDLLMARVTGRAMGIAGGVPFKMECLSPTNLTVT